MAIQLKDLAYDVIKEPSREKFREFVQNMTGEHNEIDFKEKWIDGNKLAQEMLAIANSGGGIIVVGLHENEDGTIEAPGLEKLVDKAEISNKVKKFISSNLKYNIYNFEFATSEYQVLQGRKYQIMIIEDTPEYIPFFAQRESGTLKTNIIYVRRGTKCEHATQEDIQQIINRRINYTYPQTGKPLTIDEHLKQLSELYDNINPWIISRTSAYFNPLSNVIDQMKGIITTRQKNPNYPEEKYDEFVARMILEKKKKIERVLDLH